MKSVRLFELGQADGHRRTTESWGMARTHELAAEQDIHLLFGERLRTWSTWGVCY